MLNSARVHGMCHLIVRGLKVNAQIQIDRPSCIVHHGHRRVPLRKGFFHVMNFHDMSANVTMLNETFLVIKNITKHHQSSLFVTKCH